VTPQPVAPGPQGAERRTSPRYSCDLEVESEWGSAMLKGRGRDIGATGLFIVTSAPLWLNASFSANLLAEPPISLDCVVRRVEPGVGMGVQIAPGNDDSRQRLAVLIESLASRPASHS
jgi:hypothetical protein